MYDFRSVTSKEDVCALMFGLGGGMEGLGLGYRSELSKL